MPRAAAQDGRARAAAPQPVLQLAAELNGMASALNHVGSLLGVLAASSSEVRRRHGACALRAPP
jgi:hypothetical protein